MDSALRELGTGECEIDEMFVVALLLVVAGHHSADVLQDLAEFVSAF